MEYIRVALTYFKTNVLPFDTTDYKLKAKK